MLRQLWPSASELQSIKIFTTLSKRLTQISLFAPALCLRDSIERFTTLSTARLTQYAKLRLPSMPRCFNTLCLRELQYPKECSPDASIQIFTTLSSSTARLTQYWFQPMLRLPSASESLNTLKGAQPCIWLFPSSDPLNDTDHITFHP